MIPATLLLVFECAICCLHPFHLSICEIKYDIDSKSLQITTSLFQDDLEFVFNQISGTSDYFNEVNESRIREDLKEFFEEHLQVSIDDRSRTTQFLGFEIDEYVVWCYLEINQVISIGEIFVKYTPLIDTFDDQINLAHIRYLGKVRSLKFQRKQLTGTAVFTD